MLVKHAERTLKKGCSRCGATGLYWAHDSDQRGGYACARPQCQDAPTGALVLIERDGTRHSERCGKSTTTTTHPAPLPEPAPIVDTPEPTSAASGAMDDPVEVLRRIVGSTVDRSEVEGWARAAIAESQTELAESIARLRDEIHAPTIVKVDRCDGAAPRDIPGVQHAQLPKLIAALSRGCHVMLVGPAGTGKSTMAHQACDALGISFGAISLSPQTPAAQLLGYMDGGGNYRGTVFRSQYAGNDVHPHGGGFLFDEIDNGHPSILATMNAALANGAMAFADGMAERGKAFVAIASANTFGRGHDRMYVGRSAIDAATRDRFVKLFVGYDKALEDSLAAATGYDQWHEVTRVVRSLRDNADTHKLQVVVSPRATVAICHLMQTEEWSWSDAVDATLRDGLADADWAKLTQGADLSGPSR